MIRIALRTLLILLAGALVLVLGGVLALRLGAATWAVNLVLQKVNPLAGTRLEAEKAVGNGFSWLELSGLRLTSSGGEVPLSVASARIRYDPGSLLTDQVVVYELLLTGPRLLIRQRPDSSWDIPQLPAQKPKSPGASGKKLSIHRIRLTDATVLVRPGAPYQDSLTVSLEGEGSLTERGLQFSRAVVRSHLAYRDLRFLGSRFDRDGEAALTLHASGTTRRVEFQLNAALPEGGAAQARGVLTPPNSSPLEYRVQGDFRGLDPTLFLSGGVLPRRIDGTVVVDLHGATLDRLGGRTDIGIHSSASLPRDRRQVTGGARFEEGRARIDLESHLGFASVRLRGWARPFDSVPSYDVKARAQYVQRISSPWLQRLLGKEDRSLTLSLAGSGFDPRRADLRLLAAVDPASGQAELLDSGSVDLRLNAGAARIRAVVGATGGTVTVAGTAKLDPELILRLERGSIKGVDLAALLGDSSASLLDAAFTLESRGTSPGLADGRARVLVAGLSYGSHTVSDGRFNVRIDRGTVHLNGEARVDGALVDATAAARPFDTEPSVTVRRLGFLRLDLARLLPNSGVPGAVSGTVRGHGRGRRLDHLRLSSVISLEPSQIGNVALTRATIQADLVRGRVTFKGDADAPAGQIALAGFALPFDSLPSYALEDVEFQKLDLGRLLSRDGLHTRLTGSLRAEGSGRKPEGAEATGLLTLGSSAINDAAITSGRVEVKLAGGKLDLTGLLRAQDDSLTLAATAYPFENRPRVRLTSDVAIKAVAQFLGGDLPDAGGTAGVRVEGQWGSPETLSLKGDLFGRGHVGEVQLDSLRTRIGVKDGVLTVDTLALRSSVGTAAGSGKVAWFGQAARSSDLRLVGRLGDIAQLAPLLGVTRMALDSGSFTASVSGPRDGLRLGLVAQAGNLEVGSRRVGALQASLSGTLAADHSLASGTADVHLERLLTGRTRVSEIRVQGTKQGSKVLLRAESVVDQERNARLVTHLDLDSSRARLDTLEVRLQDNRWTLAHPVRVAYGDRIQVDDFLVAAGGRRISIDGVVDRRGEQQLNARVDSLRLGPWAEFFGAPEMDGEINGAVKLSGPAATPHAEGQVDVAIRSRDKRVGTAKGRLDWSTAGLQLDIGVRQPDGDSLKLTGRIPLALSLAAGDSAGMVSRIPGGTLALAAVTRGFKLGPLEPLFDQETVRKLRGNLVMNARAAGTLEAPQLTGEVTLADARIRIPRLGATYDKGQVRLRLQGQEVRVVQARMESGGGHLETQGTIHLRGFPQVALDLQTTLSKFRIAAAEDFRSSLSGALKLGGAAAAPVLTGSLDVRNSDVYLQAKNLQQSAEAVELSPEDLRTLDRRFGYVAGRSGVARKPLAPWNIDLKVRLTENNWLRRRSDPVMAVELAGKLDVRKAPGEDINVFGEIQPLPGRSFVQVMGRRFELREGAVNLSGPLAQTAVALKAEYRAPSPSGTQPVVISTAVQSDSGKLTVTLSSIPVMRAEDIMSYLTTGRPASTDPTLASDEQGALNTSASLAVGAALGTVAGSAGQKLGFDVVQVLQDREGGQTLVAGKYVSPPLYLGFRQPIVPATDRGSSDTETEVVEFEVEYAALRQLLLNLQGGGNEFRIFLRLRR